MKRETFDEARHCARSQRRERTAELVVELVSKKGFGRGKNKK